MKRYRIGEIAALLGLTTQALRFYEQEGIIVPGKSESGTRFFTSSDIVRLLAFKKYQLSEFSVQDVSTHFQQGSLEELIARLDARSEALICQSDMLLRRARAIRSFSRTLSEVKANVGQLSCAQRPQIYLQNLTFDQLSNLKESQRAAFTAFLGAMPQTQIVFSCFPGSGADPEFRFGIGLEEAGIWSIPLEDAICLPPARCVRAYVHEARQPWEDRCLLPLLERVRKAGYRPDSSRPILGQHLASETVNHVVSLYSIIWIPILND